MQKNFTKWNLYNICISIHFSFSCFKTFMAKPVIKLYKGCLNSIKLALSLINAYLMKLLYISIFPLDATNAAHASHFSNQILGTRSLTLSVTENMVHY